MMRTSLVWCGLLAGAVNMAHGADAAAPGGGEAEARSACASRVYPPNPPNEGILFVDHAKNNRGGHLGHALVQYAPGKILAFYPNTTAGHSAVGWMEFKRSEDGGQTWSDPQELAFTKELFEKNTGRTAMAEKAVVTDKGEIVLFFLVCDVSQNALWRPYWVPLVSRSSDAGKTWSEPKPVTASRGRIYDAIYQDGEIRVLHFANDATESNPDPWTGSKEEHVYELHVSTDGGKTFSRRSVLPLETYGRGYGSLGQLGNGELITYVYNINNENMLDYVISRDGGKTWPKTGTSNVSRKIRNPQFIAFDGKYYLHGRSGHGPGHMILYMSDDGVTWDDGVYLRMREAGMGMGAYSNSIVVDDPDGSGKQRLLIQASHAYNRGHATNVLHWWLESKTAETPKGEGETLYNGIVLPQTWPPGMDSNSDDPMPVPYLDSPPEIIPIDIGRQLFVDDFLVEKTDMERVFHKPVEHEKNPVLTPIREEGNFVALLSGGVFWNPQKKRFEMYFASGSFNNRSLNLATSQDMIQWKRTDVGGDNGSCIFEPGKWVPGDERAGSRAIHVVILDLAAKDPAERYKILMQRSHGGKHTHVLRTSPDLVQWSEGILAGPGHDTSLAFYNPFRNKWVFSIKGQTNQDRVPYHWRGRYRYYLEKDSFTEGSDWSGKRFWAGADRLDLPEPADGYPDHPEEGGRPQLYNLHAMPYESLMVGLFEIHRGPHNNACEKGRFPKLTDINVGFSRDGFHWDRPDRSGFINSTRTPAVRPRSVWCLRTS